MQGHNLAMALRTAYLALHRQTNTALVDFGVTADQFVVLASLADGAAPTQRELVERTSSDPNTLRAMLVLLERQHLIDRPKHPTDGRARSVMLTDHGREVFQQLWQGSEELREQLGVEFTEHEITTLITLLQRVESSMGRRTSTSGKTRHGAVTSATQ